MSKDFCSNGLRLGVLLTPHNPRLVRVLAQTSMLMKVSSPADVLFSALLTSPRSPTASNLPFVDWFIGENRRRLTDAHALVRTWFEKRGVRVADSCAGHFAWVQLGDRLGWSTVAQEKAGFQRMLDGGVYLGPSPPSRTHLFPSSPTGADPLPLPVVCARSPRLGLQRAQGRLVPRDVRGRARDAARRPRPRRADPRPAAGRADGRRRRRFRRCVIDARADDDEDPSILTSRPPLPLGRACTPASRAGRLQRPPALIL